jgi:5-methylcytosine-specific restriction endonuclease McrA
VQDRKKEKGRKKRKVKGGLGGSGQVVPEEDSIRREKEKARSLRRSAWWMRKLSEGVCYYCREKVGSRNLTMDHVIPLSRGGKSLKGNIVACCKECNNRKKYLIPVEWDEYLKKLAGADQERDS